MKGPWNVHGMVVKWHSNGSGHALNIIVFTLVRGRMHALYQNVDGHFVLCLISVDIKGKLAMGNSKLIESSACKKLHGSYTVESSVKLISLTAYTGRWCQEEYNHIILQRIRKTTINKSFFGSGAQVQQITPITHEEIEDKSDKDLQSHSKHTSNMWKIMLYFVTSNMHIGNFFVISNQYLNLILVVYLVVCFGCQKNKTNSLLTSSHGNGFWERPRKSKYIERVL